MVFVLTRFHLHPVKVWLLPLEHLHWTPIKAACGQMLSRRTRWFSGIQIEWMDSPADPTEGCLWESQQATCSLTLSCVSGERTTDNEYKSILLEKDFRCFTFLWSWFIRRSRRRVIMQSSHEPMLLLIKWLFSNITYKQLCQTCVWFLCTLKSSCVCAAAKSAVCTITNLTLHTADMKS